MQLNEVITSPILTEKTHAQMSKGIYTFIVDKRAHKIEIAHAIELIFKVKVKRVNTINVDSKPKKVGKFDGFLPSYKKAIVYLKEGVINFFPKEEIAEVKKPIKKKEVVKKMSVAEEKAAQKIAAKKVQIVKKTTSKLDTKVKKAKPAINKKTKVINPEKKG